jgi:hypothetical protein
VVVVASRRRSLRVFVLVFISSSRGAVVGGYV